MVLYQMGMINIMKSKAPVGINRSHKVLSLKKSWIERETVTVIFLLFLLRTYCNYVEQERAPQYIEANGAQNAEINLFDSLMNMLAFFFFFVEIMNMLIDYYYL